MILGNIITDEKIEGITGFNQYTFDELIGVDTSLPTLYVGYTLTKKHFGYIDPLTHKIDEKTFWCNTKKENNRSFVQEVFRFQMYAHKFKVKNFKYKTVNILIKNERSVIYEILNDKNNVKIIIGEKSIYLKYKEIVYIIDINSLKFIGFKLNYLIRHINKKTWVVFEYEKMDTSIKRFCNVMGYKMYASEFI